MNVLAWILLVVYIVVCLALVGIVLLQKGKSMGLGSITGAADTFYGKNKARSMEGTLERVTKYLAIVFIVLSAALVVVIK
ncbi:MAG: preprotein translocase, SecG subunit [Clostridiales bacterium]|jgi:preprotein translocase subunit SecG|nr:preprotein translocase, SecG subunit [Clostridiales bacterium]